RAAFGGDAEDLVGGEDREAGLVRRHAFEQSRAAVEQADDMAFANAHPVSEVVDDLVVDHGQPELFPEPAGYILAERAHLARDSDDRHLALPRRLTTLRFSRTVL